MFILATRILPFFLLVIMSLSVASINCNGLRTKSKLQNIFSHFEWEKNITSLQETFWDDNLINSFVKFNWDGDIFFSNFEGDYFCKRIAILFIHDSDCNVMATDHN